MLQVALQALLQALLGHDDRRLHLSQRGVSLLLLPLKMAPDVAQVALANQPINNARPTRST